MKTTRPMAGGWLSNPEEGGTSRVPSDLAWNIPWNN
jgi:hypothetical protein